MQELKINPTFRDLIPPLADHELAGLEEDILHFGCQSPITTWKGFIIDGHHRYEICTRHKFTFKTEERKFEDEIAVKRWMIKNQFGRRNLPIEERLRLAFSDTDLEELQAEAKARSASNNRYTQAAEKEYINESSPVNTRETSGRTLEKIAKKAGCGHVTAYQYKKIADAGQLDRLKEESIKKVAKEIQHKEKKEAREQTLKATEFPKGKYRVIYADPPWDYGSSPTAKYTGDPTRHYPVMSIDSICEMPVKQIADENAVLFLWTTSYHIFQSKAVLDAWGFDYKSTFVWDKVKHNMGCYNSVRHEFLLIATKGACTPDNQELIDSVQTIERAKHSEKPEEFRQIIETLYKYGNKIELFARKKTEGWDVYGNECG